VEADSQSRFAVYLLPPYTVVQPIVEIHTLLRKQFGFVAADRFQVHATIKGFFKQVAGSLALLEERLDGVFAAQRPFPMYISGYHSTDVGIGLNVSLQDGQPNHELHQFRARVVEAVRPYIAPDCDFAAFDLDNPFEAHLTLAFRDIPRDFYPDVFAFLAGAPLPTGSFMARDFHFLQFYSEDWPGNWWETLTWRLLKTWQL
jgi:2'-5' RNA ligase